MLEELEKLIDATMTVKREKGGRKGKRLFDADDDSKSTPNRFQIEKLQQDKI
jgi:hypothetical protein